MTVGSLSVLQPSVVAELPKEFPFLSDRMRSFAETAQSFLEKIVKIPSDRLKLRRFADFKILLSKNFSLPSIEGSAVKLPFHFFLEKSDIPEHLLWKLEDPRLDDLEKRSQWIEEIRDFFDAFFQTHFERLPSEDWIVAYSVLQFQEESLRPEGNFFVFFHEISHYFQGEPPLLLIAKQGESVDPVLKENSNSYLKCLDLEVSRKTIQGNRFWGNFLFPSLSECKETLKDASGNARVYFSQEEADLIFHNKSQKGTPDFPSSLLRSLSLQVSKRLISIYHRTELDADEQSCKMTNMRETKSGGIYYLSLLDQVSKIFSATSSASFSHPSCKDRIDRILLG